MDAPNISDDAVRELLNVDPIAEAELEMGQSWHDNEAVTWLGMGKQLSKSRMSEKVLASLDDTVFSNTLEDYLRKTDAEGFRTVLDIPFRGTGWGQEGCTEHLIVRFHDEAGALLTFDTFGGDSVNGGRVSFNWITGGNYHHTLPLSGGCARKDKDVFVGDFDCREALRLTMRQMRSVGPFVTPWIEQPFLWLLHYMDTKNEGYDYRAINAERILMLPIEVQAAIGVSA